MWLNHAILVIVIQIALALFVFEALEDAALDADVEIPLGAVAEGYPVEAHFPAMQVAAEGNGRYGKLLGLDVEARTEVNRELIGEPYVSRQGDCLNQIVLQLVALPRAGRDDIVEVVADIEVPGHLEVDRLLENIGGRI